VPDGVVVDYGAHRISARIVVPPPGRAWDVEAVVERLDPAGASPRSPEPDAAAADAVVG
jgi:hypothetical protein